NVDGHPDNPCHDIAYCCVYYNNPANKCPNTGPCTAPPGINATEQTLTYRTSFMYTYVSIAILLILDIVFAIIAYMGTPKEKPNVNDPGQVLNYFVGAKQDQNLHNPSYHPVQNRFVKPYKYG